MSKFELTSGRITSLSRLLIFLSENDETDLKSALLHLVRLQQIPTEQLAKDVKSLAFTLGLVSDEEGSRSLSAAGKAIALGTSDGNAIALQRRLLLKIIQTIRRDLLWLAFATPQEIFSEMPQVHQILSELKLVGRNPSKDAQQFWADLRVIENQLDEAILKKIGDQAEAWSVHFEKRRLAQSGMPNLANDVIWLSRESDLHGYDILSFSGMEPQPRERRHIEVKRCRVSKSSEIEFFFSRNEFNQCQQLGSKYVFHLWWLESGLPRLAIVTGQLVTSRLPIDYDESNYWTECKVSIPIVALQDIYEQAE